MYEYEKELTLEEAKEKFKPHELAGLNKILQYRCNNGANGKDCLRVWREKAGPNDMWSSKCSNELNPQKCIIHISFDFINEIRKNPGRWAVQNLQSNKPGRCSLALLIVKGEIKI